MKGNPFWDYSNPNNAVCMCSKHHDQYEKLNADDRILYIQNYSKVPFTGKIISRMKALLKRKKPLAIYPKVKSKKQVGRMMTNIILKEFMPDEMF